MRVAYVTSPRGGYGGLATLDAVDRRRLAALIDYWVGYGIEVVPWTPEEECDVVYIVSLQNSLSTAERILSSSRNYAVVGGIIEDPFFAAYAPCPSDDLGILKEYARAYSVGWRGLARGVRRGIGLLGLGLDPMTRLMKTIRKCDGIVTTSEGQSTMVRKLNLNAIGIADCMPETDFGGRVCSYSQREPLSIVWEGTSWGLQLVELVRPALEEVHRLSNVAVEFVFVGPRDRPTPLHGLMNNEIILAENYNIPSRWVEWRLDTIGRVLSEASIGIAPMPLRNPFYRNKAYSKPLSYMACGLPVVASPVPAYKEIIQSGVTGMLAETTEEWTQALLCLIGNVEERERLGRAGLQVAEQNSCQVCAQKFLKMFDDSHNLFTHRK